METRLVVEVVGPPLVSDGSWNFAVTAATAPAGYSDRVFDGGAVRRQVPENSSQPALFFMFKRAQRLLAKQQWYSDMKSAAVAGSGGGLALHPSLTVLSQEGVMLK
jgi:hypothetical protein